MQENITIDYIPRIVEIMSSNVMARRLHCAVARDEVLERARRYVMALVSRHSSSIQGNREGYKHIL